MNCPFCGMPEVHFAGTWLDYGCKTRKTADGEVVQSTACREIARLKEENKVLNEKYSELRFRMDGLEK